MVRTCPEGTTTADDLLREIARLYPLVSGTRADPAIERVIRRYAQRHWWLTSGITLRPAAE